MLSIIIPAYNAAGRIEACLDSIFCQDTTDVEVLVVDDGSTDTTGAVCDAYAERHDGLRILHTPNGGVSRARNRGMQEAKGEWIWFVDADDTVTSQALSLMRREAGKADLLCFAYDVLDENGHLQHETLPLTIHTDRYDQMCPLRFTRGRESFGYPWNKLFRRDLIINNRLAFPIDLRFREDEVFVAQYLLEARSVRLVNESVYIYRETQTGLTHQAVPYDALMRLATYRLEEIKTLGRSEYTRQALARTLRDVFRLGIDTNNADERQACAVWIIDTLRTTHGHTGHGAVKLKLRLCALLVLCGGRRMLIALMQSKHRKHAGRS